MRINLMKKSLIGLILVGFSAFSSAAIENYMLQNTNPMNSFMKGYSEMQQLRSNQINMQQQADYEQQVQELENNAAREQREREEHEIDMKIKKAQLDKIMADINADAASKSKK